MPRRNPFSIYGFASQFGNPSAVFAAYEAARVGTQFAGAYETATNPDRILSQWQRPGQPDVRQDQYLQTQAASDAMNKGMLQAVKGLESLPLLGPTVIKFADTIAGTTAGLEQEQKAIQRAVQAHERAIGANNEYAVRLQRLAGNTVGATAEQGRQQVAAAAADLAANPADPQLQRRLHLAQVAAAEEVTQAAVRREAGLSDINARGLSFRLEGAAASANLYDSDQARDLRQRAAGVSLANRYNNQLATEQDPDRRAAIQREGTAAVAAQGAKNEDENVQAAIRRENAITQAQGEQQAARLRMAHDEAGASVEMFDAAAKQRLNGVRNASQEEQKAVRDSLNAQRQALVQQNQEITADANIRAGIGTIGAGLRGQRRDWDASFFEFEQGGRERIRMLPADQREAAARELNAQVQARRSARDFQLTEAGRGLKARDFEADFRIGDQDQRAGTFARVQGLLSEWRKSDPALQWETRNTALREIAAIRHDTLDAKGGGEALVANRGEVVNDPLGLTGRAKELKDIAADLDKAEATLRAQKAPPDLKQPGASDLAAMGGAGALPGGSGTIFDFARWVPSIQEQTGYQKRIAEGIDALNKRPVGLQ